MAEVENKQSRAQMPGFRQQIAVLLIHNSGLR
jgi:hypothetical protein